MIFVLLQVLFSLVMAKDAWQRRCRWHWYLIIALPFGELYYFFRLFLRAPEFRSYRTSGNKPAKQLEHAKRDFNLSASLHNRRSLAEALLAKGAPGEALNLLQPFEHQHGDDLAFRFLLGRAYLALGESGAAIEIFQKIVAANPKAFDFAVWLYLVAAFAQHGQLDRALESMAKLQTDYPRLKHQLTMAAYLARSGQVEKARDQLKEAIATYDAFPEFLHWEHGFWVGEAKRMLRDKRHLPM